MSHEATMDVVRKHGLLVYNDQFHAKEHSGDISVGDLLVASPGFTKKLAEEHLGLRGHDLAAPFSSLRMREQSSLAQLTMHINHLKTFEQKYGKEGENYVFKGTEGTANGRRMRADQLLLDLESGKMDKELNELDKGNIRSIGPVGLLDWATATSYSAPAFTPTRTITCTTLAQFNSAWSGLQAGDLVNCSGITFTGEVSLTNKNLSGPAEIHFDAVPGSICQFVGFTGGTRQNLPAVWLDKLTNIRFFGGDIQNSFGGKCMMTYMLSNVLWYGFVAHNCSSGNTASFCVDGNISNTDFKGEAYDNGHYRAFDTHSEKGTGDHGANLSDSTYNYLNNRWALDVHDNASGAGLEIGAPSATTTGNTIYIRANHLNQVATQQVAANAAQSWGGGTISFTIPYLEAANLQGRAWDSNGQYSSTTLANSVIQYGRATNTNLNPYLGSTEPAIPASQPWDPRHSMVFQDIGAGGGGGGGAAPVNTGLPVISGQPVIGSQLSASTGSWNNTPTSYAYQWQADNHGNGIYTDVGGATASTITPQTLDGSNLRVRVTATNASGSASATSASKLVSMPAPVNTSVPTISGTPTIGSTLTASPGVWTGMNGYNPSFTYQWYRIDSGGTETAISGATGNTYVVQSGDAGYTLKVRVTAHNTATG